MKNNSLDQDPPVTILGSGVHLGVYVPALLLQSGLHRQGVAAETLIIEELYQTQEREKLPRLKKLFHQNFKAALMAHKMVRDIRSSLDDKKIEALLQKWESQKRRHFCLWSGYWMPVIEEYRLRIHPEPVQIDICRIDAVESATFLPYESIDLSAPGYREIWLWQQGQGRLHYSIGVSPEKPLSYDQRNGRYVIHGGGWGIGLYREKIQELGQAGLKLDVIAYEPEEASGAHRYFMVDPAWRAWEQSGPESYIFPPFGEVATSESLPGNAASDELAPESDAPGERLHGKASAKATGELASEGAVATEVLYFRHQKEYHAFFDLMKEAEAVISKPGGGALIDSLASATPLIFLEPYGYAEQANAELWEKLGLGVSYEKWVETGYSRELLEEAHCRLLEQREKTIDYARFLAEETRGG